MSDETPAEVALQRDFTGLTNAALSILCFLIAVGHIYVAFDPIISEFQRNAYHFAGFAFLAAVLHPLVRGRTRSKPMLAFDLTLGVLVAVAAIYMPFAEQGIYDRGVKFSALDWVAAVICIVGAIELTRRLTGWVIPCLIIIAISYVGWWGQLIGGVFSFPGLSWESIAFRSIFGDDAMFGTIARISSTFVFLFIIFGAFLLRSGAGDFVINIARAIAGRLVGGPGIVAVIASGLTGTISGSAVANTASTGVITIPLMKKAGFPPKFAGGVEAASSTGGQLMPPIMGAGAFVMASFTQIPYETIVAVAALPALLYFLSVVFFVRIEARRLGLEPMSNEDGETIWSAFKKGGASFIIPIGLLIALLVSGFTPAYAAVFGIITVIAASWLTQNPMGPRAVFEALVMGTKGMIMTAVLLCAVGLVVNVIATAGIGNTFSLMISDWAGGNLLIAIVMVAIASLVLGMGLPVTAAYIVLATLSAPALAGMISDRFVIEALASGTLPDAANAVLMFGLPDPSVLSGPLTTEQATAIIRALPLEVAAPLRDIVVPQEVAVAAILSAHMIIFWLSQDSNVTPPVALAAFTAAAIAKAPAMATGFASWKLAKGLYIVPLMMAYTPFLSGDWGVMLVIFAFGVVGIYGLAGALQGCMEAPLNPVLRIVAGVAGAACIWPAPLWLHLIAATIVIVLLALNSRQAKVVAA
ncbi:TRAP transporter permease [Yoonia sp.]|uniref:TRAP transporter permease n=1 Tax=Yoonia sp. TaxID=2212373 RepID=UPI00397695DF